MKLIAISLLGLVYEKLQKEGFKKAELTWS